ncbi:MAG TPA: tetratricopeptide repeat protein [Polyangiaceae bacterium]|nr:tetratricopeptide repeat protein [Polyangiaceae bacterium]
MNRIFMLLLLALLLVQTRVQAQDPAERQAARKLGEEGDALFDKGEYQSALEKYRKAAELIDVPTLRLREARSLEKLGRLVEASERYLSVVRTEVPADAPQDHRDSVTLAREEHAALEPRIPNLVVNFSGSGSQPRVTLDGAPFPAALLGEKRPVDPGKHRIEAQRGDSRFARDIEAREGAVVTVDIELPAERAAPTPRPKPQPIEQEPNLLWPLGWAALGVGVAGLAVGGITGGLAIDRRADLERDCGDALDCPPRRHDDVDSYNSLRIASAVGFYAGGAFAATGIVLLVVSALDDDAERAWTPLFPLGVRASF